MTTLFDDSQLKATFRTAKNFDEMHKAFKQTEKEGTLPESELGLACVLLGFKLVAETNDYDKVLSFATRALKALDTDDNEPSFALSNALHLMGTALYGLNRFSDCLGYLTRADAVLGRLIDEESLSLDDVWNVVHGLQIMLAKANVAVENFKEALPFCLKSLELREKWLGPNSVEAEHARKLLEVIYLRLGEDGKAHEQFVSVRRTMKDRNAESDLLLVEIDDAEMMGKMGQFDEAIRTLKNVVKQSKENIRIRALALISMARVFCNQEKCEESKRCLEICLYILAEREQISPVEVADAYSEIWELYKTMDEIEKAISLLKKTLALLEKLPAEQHRQGNVLAEIGMLLVKTDKEQQAIPYFEKAAERLKYSFGPKHFEVGAMYNNLGASYMELDKPEKAAEMFEIAKDIMVASLGPHHEMTIGTCENLSNAQEKMGGGLCFFHAVQQALAKQLSKIYVVPTSPPCHPPVKWAQRSEELYITVELPDAHDVKVRLEPEGKFYFSANAGADKIFYEVNLDLFDKVDVKSSKASIGSRNIFYLVKKAESKWWDRLLKQGGKPPVFLKVDWDKWVDEDEEEEADEFGADMDFSDFDFSKMNMGRDEGLDDDDDDDNYNLRRRGDRRSIS